MTAVLALVSLIVGLAQPVASAPAPQTWPIDPAQSQAQFSVRKFWFAHVRGTFPELHGTLRRIDTRIGVDLAQVDATLAVSNLKMDDASDRVHALGDNFFDATRFPVIRFESDPFPLGELVAGGTLRGMLTLHGEQHQVALALQPSDCPRQPLGCVIRVAGTISRSAFGMRAWRGVLSDKVELDLRIVLRSLPNKPSSGGSSVHSSLNAASLKVHAPTMAVGQPTSERPSKPPSMAKSSVA